MIIAIQDLIEHFERLDVLLSGLLPRALHYHLSRMEKSRKDGADISGVMRLLHRLPRTPWSAKSLGMETGYASGTSLVRDRIRRATWLREWPVEETKSKYDQILLPRDLSVCEIWKALRCSSKLLWGDTRLATCNDRELPSLARCSFNYVNILTELLKGVSTL